MIPFHRLLGSLLVTIATAAPALAAAAPAPETLRVPQDFDTIQQAVDAALPGDEVLVSKGVYPGHVLILNHNDISLRGKGRPVVLGGTLPTDGEEEVDGGIRIQSSNGISVKGFVVRDTLGDNGVSVSSSNDVRLTGIVVENTIDRDGVGVASSNDVIIDRVRVTGGNDDSIELSSSNNVLITRCVIDDVGHDGIHLASSSDVLVERCKLYEVAGKAFHISGGGSTRIERSKISRSGTGLDSSGNADVDVYKLRFDRIEGDGILHRGRELTVDTVTFKRIDGVAMEIEPSAGPAPEPEDGAPIDGPVSINKVRINTIGHDGVLMLAHGAQVTDVVVKNVADDDGFVVSDRDGVDFERCKAVSVGGTGFSFDNVTNSSLRNSRVVKAGGHGVDESHESSGNTFENVRVIAPGNHGFRAAGSGDTYVGNYARKAGAAGFFVGGAGNSFTLNRANGSGDVDLRDTAGQGANEYVDNTFGTEVIEDD